MIPVLTAEAMRSADSASSDSEDVLIARAGWAVARTAIRMLGGTYGRRITVVAGKGNNGADGRVAADLLRRKGARVRVVEPTIPSVPESDLIIDAVFGTGFRGTFAFPKFHSPLVLAVDIPSGVQANTGSCDGDAAQANVTVTFAAYKPGHLFGTGAVKSGRVELADIGLRLPEPTAQLLEASDVLEMLPSRMRTAHKWNSGVLVVAGSPEMLGAARLTAAGAARAGAGIVHLGLPGVPSSQLTADDVVMHAYPSRDWARCALSSTGRMAAMIIGPGLGRDEATLTAVRESAAGSDVALVIDADGLFAFGDGRVSSLRSRVGPTILTPHDGEFERLAGRPVGDDRLAAARMLAVLSGSTVLLKGPTTVVASPEGEVLLSNAGDSRLATAGTGDVLSGVVGAFLARGLEAPQAAACAAYVHGAASKLGFSDGLVASDLPSDIAAWLSGVMIDADV